MFSKKDYIYAIYEEKSFSKAASKLFISQPALSSSIKKIEDNLGNPIFNRTTPVTLTEFGERYIECCNKIKVIENSLAEYSDDLSSLNTGNISIGCDSLYTVHVMPSYISKFYKKYPNIKLNLTELPKDNHLIEESLKKNQLDIVIESNNLNDKLFDKHYLTTEFLMLAVPKALKANEYAKEYQMSYADVKADTHTSLGAKPVPLNLFKDELFVLPTNDNNSRERAEHIFNFYEVEPKIALEFDQVPTVYKISSTGLACSIVSDMVIKNMGSENDDMYYYSLPIYFAKRDVYFQFLKSKYLSKSLQRFISFTKDSF